MRLVTPNQTWEINLNSGESKLLKADRVLGGFVSDQYRTGHMTITARDGTEVPVSLAYHRDTRLAGSAPALIYAYGSYGSSTDPWFESIPLTTGDFNEWGDPKNKDAYEYMLSYSPYDQVSAQDYPNIMVTTGLYDSQVQYFEPAKWVAKLRDRRTDSNKLIMYTNMEAGHGGASGRYQRYMETAQEYAFLAGLAGMERQARSGPGLREILGRRLAWLRLDLSQ